MTKNCFRCEVEKEITEFYRHPQMADGHLGKCKTCTKMDVNNNREAKREYYNEYDRKRYREGRRPGPRAPNKARCRWLVENAVVRGKLTKPGACSVCGFVATTSRQIHAHHEDYDKPLEVVWVCHPCHGKIHRT